MRKKVFVIMLLTLTFTTSCHKKESNTIIGNDEIESPYLKEYELFLNGECNASLENHAQGDFNIEDIFLVNEEDNRYTCFDSNHNGILELHLLSMREYKILEYYNNDLSVIYSGSGYEKLLNNGALLYCRSGSAPKHWSYKYTQLESDYSITQVSFEKYNTENTDLTDDLYLIEDHKLSKLDFDERTKGYLTELSDLIIWSNYQSL